MGRHFEVRAASMAKTAAAKAKLYSRYGKEILVAAKAGVPDPDMNVALKKVIERAKANQVPADVIKRAIEKAKGGTLADPQKSATIMIKTQENKEKKWNIYGAGVDGTLALTVPNAAYEAMELRDVQHYEYPQGVDMVFVTDYGELFAIPRLVLRKEEQ